MGEQLFYHNSHLQEFRNPFGAVCCGEHISLRLQVNTADMPIWTVLRLWREGEGEEKVSMTLVSDDDGIKVYQSDIVAPAATGVIWYYFVININGQIYYYGNNSDVCGGVGQISSEPPPSYQITVFKQGFKTPYWFKKAVMYQIFPDRFFNGDDNGNVLNPKKGSLMHAYWDNVPYYIRDVNTKKIVAYDFFGGNLLGVIKKLSYLKDLGVSVIYFNPIFESPSNHRYDTGDYHKIDAMLGDNELFKQLCDKARSMGIAVILDGVFSHTGSDSIYFNKEGSYSKTGAYHSADSPYYKWYNFIEYPDKYESWWGIETLPNVNEMEPSYIDFIINNKESVVKYWLQMGASGWRLDVADELPDEFIKLLRCAMKKTNPESVLIGEVWEDASRKVSYGNLRQYLSGDELDSVMNYPFRKIVLDFMLGEKDAYAAQRGLLSMYENYPNEHFFSLMNLIGSHDVPRVLTLLSEAPSSHDISISEQAQYRLSFEQKKLAVARLKLMVIWQMTFPGVPCIYYGDEVGVEGYSDPFNRKTYPWGREDIEILRWYKKIIAIRKRYDLFSTGQWIPLFVHKDVYAFARQIRDGQDEFGQSGEDNFAVVLINRSSEEKISINLDISKWNVDSMVDVLAGEHEVCVQDGIIKITVMPLEGKILLKNLKTAFPRESGILLHPTSLPSKYGIGDLGSEAYNFIDFLKAGRQKLWQVLPLNPVGYGESPYQALSAFAGNPLLISLEQLAKEGLLLEIEIEHTPYFSQDKVQFDRVKMYKEKLLKRAFIRFKSLAKPPEYYKFLTENNSWLEDYALFMSLKRCFNWQPWSKWKHDIAFRHPSALTHYRAVLAEKMDYQKFLQFIFFKQWNVLKRYANEQGVKIIGDMPIFIAHDSSDVWANPQLFSLDEQGNPAKVAGVPPDYFSSTGQLWGNPHYNWIKMKNDDYKWWRERFEYLFKLTDIVRVDHFRGFEAAWEVPSGEKTAVNGKWSKGPGAKFFNVIKKHLDRLPVIAEDLGVITPEVEELKEQCYFPGMKVLHFSFSKGIDGACLPFVCEKNVVLYTGTHDNDTTLGWYKNCLSEQPGIIECVCKHTGITEKLNEEDICWKVIEFAYKSNANTVIIPLQDILCLDSKARMNYPGTVGGNWQWRMPKEYATSILAARLAALVEKNNR